MQTSPVIVTQSLQAKSKTQKRKMQKSLEPLHGLNKNMEYQKDSLKKKKKSHYLATQMGIETSGKITNPAMKLKNRLAASPEVSLVDGIRINPEYEHRTVNSAADITEEPEDVVATPRKRLKRGKLAFIDSEVDLMKTDNRPPLIMSMVKQRESALAQENGSESTTISNKVNRKRKRNVPKAPNQPPIATASDPTDLYPILKNEELIKRFLKVDFTNNQKGRIRQVIRDILRGTSSTLLPDVINNKIQTILKSSENLTDSDLRKIRVLYNMLKKATEDIHRQSGQTTSEDIFKPKNKDKNVDKEELESKDKSKVKGDNSKVKTIKLKNEEKPKDKEEKSKNKDDTSQIKNKMPKDKGDSPKKEKKDKGDSPKKEKREPKEVAKRYVVFVGNLPVDVTREQILNHFSDIREYIKDVRIPQLAPDKKSSIAYVEFENAPVYEMALSKHHSMMGRTRINVLYTTPNKKSKITKTEAKAKAAKMTAMAKKGQLVGSIPLTKKRSHRRAKARAFQRAAEKELNSVSLN